MENFNMLVLHAIMWRRRWRRKRRNTWVYPIKKDKNSEYFATYTGLCSRMKRYFMAFLEWTSSNSTVWHNWWEGKYENITPTIGGRFHLKFDLQSFKVRAIKSVGDKKGILNTTKLHFFLISVLIVTLFTSIYLLFLQLLYVFPYVCMYVYIYIYIYIYIYTHTHTCTSIYRIEYIKVNRSK